MRTVPTIDLTPWFEGGPADRQDIAERVDAEVPDLEPLIVEYLGRMRALADELLVICAKALGLEGDFFTSRAATPPTP
jgi:isopenicillin N synthase-like dioxygenase